jgi:hypothetical protein
VAVFDPLLLQLPSGLDYIIDNVARNVGNCVPALRLMGDPLMERDRRVRSRTRRGGMRLCKHHAGERRCASLRDVCLFLGPLCIFIFLGVFRVSTPSGFGHVTPIV